MAGINLIDFKNIAPRNGSQEDAFEEFCCQVARRCPTPPEGSEFIRYRGAGGDGGVECIRRLPNGDEWGWQAKYIFDLSKAKTALDESVATAIKLHPGLTRYTVCLPFDVTGPTGKKTKSGQRTKSQAERFDEYCATWETKAQAAGVNIKVTLATPSTLLDDLLSFDHDHGRLKYWFDATILGDVWFHHHLKHVKDIAFPRYTPELRIEIPIAQAFEAFGLTEEWFVSLAGRVREFKSLAADWKRCVASRGDGAWRAAFPEGLRPEGERASTFLSEVAEQYRQIAEDRDVRTDIIALAAKADEALQLFRELRIALAADLEAKYGQGAIDSAGFRQFHAEYEVSFPAANLDTGDKIVKFLESFARWVASPPAKLPAASELLILGSWGVGKTHAICDIAAMRARQSLRSLVLFGERFSEVSEPWEQIRQQLGFDAILSRDAMLAAFDAAGEASGKPLLLCIDGLNETRPHTYWPAHLPAMVSRLQRYDWIKLCISCRTTYAQRVVPPTLNFVSITHEGFQGIEFDASHEFFTHYKLEPPVTPVLLPEFTNPLFLRLLCEAMKAAGYTRLPLGWVGIETAIDALLQAKNQRFANQHDTESQHRIPERGLKAFVAAAEAAKRPVLPWSEASQAIESVLFPPQTQGPLIDWLVREGLLIVDADPHPTGQSPEDYVRVAFERFGDHLLANKILDDIGSEGIEASFTAGGALAFVVSSIDQIQEYAGLIEALAIQVRERFGIELPDCVEEPALERELTRIYDEDGRGPPLARSHVHYRANMPARAAITRIQGLPARCL